MEDHITPSTATGHARLGIGHLCGSPLLEGLYQQLPTVFPFKAVNKRSFIRLKLLDRIMGSIATEKYPVFVHLPQSPVLCQHCYFGKWG
jgi:hypothetical protein